MVYNREGRATSNALTSLHVMDIGSADFTREPDSHGNPQGFYVFNNNDDDVTLQVVPLNNGDNEAAIPIPIAAHDSIFIVLRKVLQKAGSTNLYWGN